MLLLLLKSLQSLIHHQQLLDHMNESAVYNESDLAPFQKRLDELRDIVQNDKESSKHPEAMTRLLGRQLKECCALKTYSVSI